MPNRKAPSKMPNIVHLDSDEVPDLKNWKPGQRYRVVLELEQLNMSLGGGDIYGDSKTDKDKVSASFKILSAKPQFGSGPVKQGNTDNKPAKSATMSALQRKAAQ